MSGPRSPEGWSIEVLDKSHSRQKFDSGSHEVDEWLKKSALQSQKKHLGVAELARVPRYVRWVLSEVLRLPLRENAVFEAGRLG